MGVAVILGVFGLILWRYVTIAQHSGDEFAALLLIGLGAILFVHVTVNTGMNLGLMPVTGIPLPFLSAAASYMTVTFISVGCAESVAIRRRGSNTST
jgi:rod shape determining protein RodA